jgi:hypothetical protein
VYPEPSCEAITQAGFPCQMPPMIGEDFCFAHHPDQRSAANDARKRGGERSRGSDTTPAPIDMDVGSPAGRMHMVEHVLRDTMLQANTPARSRALAALLRLAHDLDVQAEADQLQEQLRELHRLVDQQESQRGGYGY